MLSFSPSPASSFSFLSRRCYTRFHGRHEKRDAEIGTVFSPLFASIPLCYSCFEDELCEVLWNVYRSLRRQNRGGEHCMSHVLLLVLLLLRLLLNSVLTRGKLPSLAAAASGNAASPVRRPESSNLPCRISRRRDDDDAAADDKRSISGSNLGYRAPRGKGERERVCRTEEAAAAAGCSARLMIETFIVLARWAICAGAAAAATVIDSAHSPHCAPQCALLTDSAHAQRLSG